MADAPLLQMQVQAKSGSFELDLKFASPGKVTALFGPSGSGKTSTLRLIAGLNHPLRGRICVREESLYDSNNHKSLSPQERACGFVFQDAALFPHLNVLSNLTYSLWAANRPSRFGQDEIIDILAIGHLLKRFPAGLSGGEKQRVALGRALLSSPRILLLDEPFSALDEARKAEIFSFLEKIRDHLDLPIIYVSHSVPEVIRFADWVIVLDGGRVVRTGATEEIFSGEEYADVGLLVGTAQGVTDDGDFAVVDVAGQKIYLTADKLPVGKQVRLAIPPSEVILANTVPEKISAQNCLAATIHSITRLSGPVFLITLAVGDQRFKARITTRAFDTMGLKVGMQCFAILKTIALSDRAYL